MCPPPENCGLRRGVLAAAVGIHRLRPEGRPEAGSTRRIYPRRQRRRHRRSSRPGDSDAPLRAGLWTGSGPARGPRIRTRAHLHADGSSGVCARPGDDGDAIAASRYLRVVGEAGSGGNVLDGLQHSGGRAVARLDARVRRGLEFPDEQSVARGVERDLGLNGILARRSKRNDRAERACRRAGAVSIPTPRTSR